MHVNMGLIHNYRNLTATVSSLTTHLQQLGIHVILQLYAETKVYIFVKDSKAF